MPNREEKIEEEEERTSNILLDKDLFSFFFVDVVLLAFFPVMTIQCVFEGCERMCLG